MSPKKRALRECANAITRALNDAEADVSAEMTRIRNVMWDASKAEEVEGHDAGKAPMGLCDCGDNACIVRRQERRTREGLCPVCGAAKDKDFGQFCNKHGAGIIITKGET